MVQARAGACAVACAALLAVAAAADERPSNPTGWALLSPCAANCALAVYAGTYVEDSMADVLFFEPTFPTGWDFTAGDRLIGLALSRHAATLWRIDVEPELGIGQRLDQDVTEIWIALYGRYRGFPWDRYLVTTMALSTGLNYASAYSEEEIERTGETSGYRVMHFFSPEVTFAHPDNPGLELLFRFHHRSGAYGLFNDVGGGAHYGTVGLRLRF
jgi:hypothetical protein